MAGKRVLRKISGCVICALLIIANYCEPVQRIRSLPDNLYVAPGDLNLSRLPIDSGFFRGSIHYVSEASLDSAQRLGGEGDFDATLSIDLLGLVPVKQVSIHCRSGIRVMPGGASVGVKLYTDGALVVGISGFEDQTGKQQCPAARAGLKAGDVIVEANGEPVNDAARMRDICREAKNKTILLRYLREGEGYIARITPIPAAEDGEYRLGLWVRDSTAGIGTISFYDMTTLRFGALGHAITDVDVGSMLRVREGEILDSSVLGIAQGTQGQPGEMKGTFNGLSERLGKIEKNTEIGIFGSMNGELVNPLYPEGVQIAYPEEARLGEAQLLTTIDTKGVRAFDCKVIKLFEQNESQTKSMVIQITDPELIERTGGIVQGMSGSPILQDGKLLGVVTHVFVNDPQKGYCIYALWMYEQTK